MDDNHTRDADRSPQYPTLDLWTRRLATLAVAGVAAWASYQHQRDFALAGGTDLATAPLVAALHALDPFDNSVDVAMSDRPPSLEGDEDESSGDSVQAN
jgi:hypothetical protein